MPNDDTQRYVIKTDTKTYKIIAPKGLDQDQALSLAAGVNPEFAEVHAQHLAKKSLPQMHETPHPGIVSALAPRYTTGTAKGREELGKAMGADVQSEIARADKAAEIERKKSYGKHALDVALLAGGLTGGKVALGALPSAARAGQTFEAVAGAMKATPVAVPKAIAAAQRAANVISRGGISSKLVEDFLAETQSKSTVTWEAARDFLSNARSRSWLSDMFAGQTGAARHAIGEFIENLGTEIMDAAEAAGHGKRYASALREYRNAMVLARVLKGVAYVGGGLTLDYLTGSHLTHKLKAISSAIAD